MVNEKRALPVGSIVRLCAVDAPIMVMGYKPVIETVPSDFIGVVYPAGLVTENSAIAFDRESVEEVLFEGFLDEEGERAFRAVEAYDQATEEMLRQADELLESLTPERVEELRNLYSPTDMPEEFEVPEGYRNVTIE